MSSWKLVEAEPEQQEQTMDKNKPYNGGKKKSNQKGQNGRKGKNTNAYYEPVVWTQEDINYASHLAAQQIEIIFSIDNLCMDTFIRFYMDEAGYVPIALLCNYANVAMYGAPYTGIINALVRNSERTNLEVDLENETIRLKTGWEVWLMPNTTGGRGMPRYIKQAITVAPGSYDGATVSNTETSTDVTAETEGQKDKDGTETVNHCEESSAEQLDDISSGLQKVNVAQE